jgi:hypothetical protein
LATISLWITVNAQEKTIAGDTAHWAYSKPSPTGKDIELQDFETSKHDFDFRFRNSMGQVIEIWRENDSIGGILTNYIFWTKGKKEGWKTLFEKNVISPQKAESVYRMINSSGILDLPFEKDRDPETMYFCTDVSPYIFETADKQSYNVKISWAICSSKDTLQSVKQFVKQLEDTLQLRTSYDDYRKSLPRLGAYNSGGLGISAYSYPMYCSLGYFGSTKLPVGYYANLYFSYIGMVKTNIGIKAEHQFDTHGNYDFSAVIHKGNLFFNKPEKTIKGDVLWYNYRIRSLDFVDENTVFQNHKLIYHIDLKKIVTIGLGGDYSQGNDNKTGSIVSAQRSLGKSGIVLTGDVSIFNNRLDYRARVERVFSIKQKFYFITGAQYEKFMNYGDAGFFLIAIFY